MNKKTFQSLSALAIASLVATTALAEKPHDQMNMNQMNMGDKEMSGMQHGQMAAREAKGAVHAGQGTITRIDTKASKIGLQHGPIKSLNWPEMTMDFSVADPALLKPLREGQQVTFDMKPGATKGQWVITRITPIR